VTTPCHALIILAVCCLFSGSDILMAQTARLPFLDVPQRAPPSSPYYAYVPYYNYVHYLYERDITLGDGDCPAPDQTYKCFAPGRTLTRAEAAAFMIRSVFWSLSRNTRGILQDGTAGFVTSGLNYFGDVGQVAVHKANIQKLKELRVANGYTNGQFGVNDSVTKGQAAAFAVRAMQLRTLGYVQHPGKLNYGTPTMQCFSDVPFADGIFFREVWKIMEMGLATANCRPVSASTPALQPFGYHDRIARAEFAKYIVVAILGVNNPVPLGGAFGGGGPGGESGTAAVREYVRAGSRVILQETSAGGASGQAGSNDGGSGASSGYYIRPTTAMDSGADFTSISVNAGVTTPLNWFIAENGEVVGSQGSITPLSATQYPSLSAKYTPPAFVPGHSCAWGTGHSCVFSLLVQGVSSDLSRAFAFVTLHPTPPPAGASMATSPDEETFGVAGGTGLVQVSSPAGTAWTATSTQPWLQISGSGTGSGTQNLTYTVAPNPPAVGVRAAAIIVNGTASVSIGQAGASGNLSPLGGHRKPANEGRLKTGQ